MRKIEREMCAAVAERREWREDNTAVRAGRAYGEAVMSIDLHGNHIADVRVSDGRVFVNESTLARWPTNTTISRLRALGAKIEVKRRVVYLNGAAVTER